MNGIRKANGLTWREIKALENRRVGCCAQMGMIAATLGLLAGLIGLLALVGSL
jgi:hypothetical protein